MQTVGLKKPVYNYMYSGNKKKQLDYVTGSILISTMNYDSANNEIFEGDKLYHGKTLLGEVLYDVRLCEFRVVGKQDTSLNKILLKYRPSGTLIKGKNKYIEEINSEWEDIRSGIEEPQSKAEEFVKNIKALQEIIDKAQSEITQGVKNMLGASEVNDMLEDDEYYYMTE